MTTENENSRQSGLGRETRQFMSLCTIIDDYQLLSEAAKNSGVSLNVLKREGERYTTMPLITRTNGIVDPSPVDFKPTTGIVDPGNTYVMISGMVSQENGMSNFWAEVERLQKEKANPESV